MSSQALIDSLLLGPVPGARNGEVNAGFLFSLAEIADNERILKEVVSH